jgi:Flp pilus assembly protein TadD
MARIALGLLVVVASALAAGGCGGKRVPPVHPEAVHQNDECAARLQEDDLDTARQYCLQALEFSPQYPDALVNLGVIHLRSEDRAAARDAFTRALKLKEDIPEAHNDLGVLAMEDRSFEEAEKHFRRALELRPDYVQARYNLALTHYLGRQPRKAREELQPLIKAHPELSDPVHFYAVIRLEEGRIDEAIEKLIHCVTMSPQVPGYWLALGVAFGRAHRYRDAEEAFRTCLELDPADQICRDDLKLLIQRRKLPPPPVEAPKVGGSR